MRNSLSTIDGLIAKANNYRANLINSMMNAAAGKKPVDFAPLSVNASRPMALGFSAHDLGHFHDVMSDRHFRFCMAAATLENRASIGVSELARVNVKASRNGGILNRQEVAEKRDITARLSALSAQKKIEKTYADACVSVMQAIQAELVARELAAHPIVKPVVKVEPVKPVEVLTPTVSVKPVTLKLRQKGVMRSRAKQPETRVEGFEGLAMLLEHRAA
jgi:hypothetical protein